MSTDARTADESSGTTDAQPTTDPRDLALVRGSETPRSIAGATVIEMEVYERTEDGAALRYAGTTPTHVVGIESERDAREALQEAGYDDGEITRAIARGERLTDERPDATTDAIRAAERRDPEARALVAMADGGRELTGDHPLDGRCGECGTHYIIDETVTNECPECGFNAFGPVATDGGAVNR